MKKRLTFLGWPLVVVPVVIEYLGDFLNQIAIAVNHGSMPVEGSACLIDPSSVADSLHVCMTKASHLKFFCDWIFMGFGIGSPGDLLIFLSGAIQGPLYYIWLTLLVICVYAKKDFWLE